MNADKIDILMQHFSLDTPLHILRFLVSKNNLKNLFFLIQVKHHDHTGAATPMA
jgi:hypothetical protein